MTRLWQAGILIAIFAALLGAPSAVLGAAGDELSGASASPTSGSTATVFIFRIRYTSDGGDAAVSMTVAGRTLAMSRTSGTAADGTYQASAMLPAGSWPTSFRADPAEALQPSLSGPTIEVAAAPMPSPSVGATLAVPKSTSPSSPSMADAATDTAASPEAIPAPTAAPAQAPAAPAPSDPPQVVTAPQQAAATAPAAEARGAAEDAPRAPTAAGASATPAAPDTVASPVGVQASPDPARSQPLVPGSDSRGSTLAVVVFGVGVLALTGVAWLVLAGRRRGADDGLLAVGGMAGGRAGLRRGHGAKRDQGAKRRVGPDLADTMAERAVRRARLDPSDDPIIAAMGLPSRDGGATGDGSPSGSGSASRDRARQVNVGPGERPLRQPRRRR